MSRIYFDSECVVGLGARQLRRRSPSKARGRSRGLSPWNLAPNGRPDPADGPRLDPNAIEGSRNQSLRQLAPLDVDQDQWTLLVHPDPDRLDTRILAEFLSEDTDDRYQCLGGGHKQDPLIGS